MASLKFTVAVDNHHSQRMLAQLLLVYDTAIKHLLSDRNATSIFFKYLVAQFSRHGPILLAGTLHDYVEEKRESIIYRGESGEAVEIPSESQIETLVRVTIGGQPINVSQKYEISDISIAHPRWVSYCTSLGVDFNRMSFCFSDIDFDELYEFMNVFDLNLYKSLMRSEIPLTSRILTFYPELPKAEELPSLFAYDQ